MLYKCMLALISLDTFFALYFEYFHRALACARCTYVCLLRNSFHTLSYRYVSTYIVTCVSTLTLEPNTQSPHIHVCVYLCSHFELSTCTYILSCMYIVTCVSTLTLEPNTQSPHIHICVYLHSHFELNTCTYILSYTWLHPYLNTH